MHIGKNGTAKEVKGTALTWGMEKSTRKKAEDRQWPNKDIIGGRAEEKRGQGVRAIEMGRKAHNASEGARTERGGTGEERKGRHAGAVAGPKMMEGKYFRAWNQRKGGNRKCQRKAIHGRFIGLRE